MFGPLDALNIAAMEHPIELALIAPTMDPVSTKPPPKPGVPAVSKFGEGVMPTHTYDSPPKDIDVLMIPGGIGTYNDTVIKPVIELARELSTRSRYLFSICSGAGVLARAGVLEGKRATTNKKRWEIITKYGDEVDWIEKARWVVDGNTWTTSGISAGIDGMLGFLAHIYGSEYAKQVAHTMEYRWADDSTSDPFAVTLNQPGNSTVG